ncbi:unnamed protein product [Periconia digitata]|uniref:Uncharacterized protein n=1 Tax=Periconia digitata TaxID=1303443 RepID=A0A9W4UUI7_9PLEO|nr:unnamed protein product [Periconia digitata]
MSHNVYGTAVPTQSTTTPTSHSRRASRTSFTQQAHSYRVEKPRSNHNSPMVLERRKTTTGAKLYASLDDHYRMLMGITDEYDMTDDYFQPASTRPVSWHPTSSHPGFVPQQQEYPQPQDWTRHYSSSSGTESASSSDFYSISARNSAFLVPPQDQPVYMNASQTSLAFQDPITSYAMSTSESLPWYLQEWARRNQDQIRTTDDGSTNFLPIQHPPTEQNMVNSSQEETIEESGKELIGMGLYDLPDSAADLGSLAEATGKGLKLEETWQPPEEDDEEEDDDENVDNQEEDDSSDDCEDELPSPPTQQQPQQLQVPSMMKPQMPNSMAGHSFLFDEEDMATKEWWYHQYKQPTMPVQDTGMGYNWV